ncbi:MAG: MarR family transcriptional regulator [Aeromicrobium sp.]
MQEDRAAFIEGFALKLNESGMQRMAARVFAALLTAPGGGLTAREIAETLDVSAAAVSGATSYLTRTKMAERSRIPGERTDRYDVRGTTWAEAMAVETEMLHTLSSWLDKGAALVTGDSEATQRLKDTRDFFDFVAVEMPKLVDRWQSSRRRA